MISWTAVQKALQDWVVLGSGLNDDHVIWEQQSGPTPTGVYCTLKIIGIRIIGRDWTDFDNNPLIVDLTASALGSSTIDIAAHNLQTGDGPIQLAGASLPAGLVEDTNYWVVRVDADTIRLSSTFLNAMAGTTLTFSGGSLPLDLDSTDDTERVGQELSRKVRGVRELMVSVQCFGSSTGPNGAAIKMHDVQTRSFAEDVIESMSAVGVSILRFGNMNVFDGLVGQGRFEPRARFDVTCSLSSEVEDFINYIDTVEGTNLITNQPFTIQVTDG